MSVENCEGVESRRRMSVLNSRLPAALAEAIEYRETYISFLRPKEINKLSLQLEHGRLSRTVLIMSNKSTSSARRYRSRTPTRARPYSKRRSKQRREESSERPGKSKLKSRRQDQSSGGGVPNCSATNQPNRANQLPPRSYQLPATPAAGYSNKNTKATPEHSSQ